MTPPIDAGTRARQQIAAEVLTDTTEQIAADAKAALAVDEPWLALLLDGLRATDRPSLPVPPPPLTALDSILKAGKRHP